MLSAADLVVVLVWFNTEIMIKQSRVSVPQNKTVMLFIAMGMAYIIKVYDINKPASVAWVEQNVKLTISQYVAPGSVNASLDFTISTLILWLCIYMSYRK